MDDVAPAPSSIASHGETTEPRVPHRLYALKDGDTFLVADAYGDVTGVADGLFHNDTRLLSTFALRIGSERASLLSAAISRDSVFFTAHLTNKPLPLLGGRAVPQGVIHIERDRFLWRDRMYERICCRNFSQRETVLPLKLRFHADFRDMFEVRGVVRATRGRLQPVDVRADRLSFSYCGLDGVERRTVVSFSLTPDHIGPDLAAFSLLLPAEASAELYVEVAPVAEDEKPNKGRFRHAAACARRSMRKRMRRGVRLRTSGRLFNEWIEKSRADLALLTTELPTGPYPYAGIPWFSTAFGRDAIITAMQMLWIDPAIASGVLRYLAKNQAEETSAFQDAQPGKIMHETRKGEMTSLRELPFGQYYGGVDTTPLFVMLAAAYAERIGAMDLVDELWGPLCAAIGWIEVNIGEDPRGYLTYRPNPANGLVNQGWKDSDDSIFHADGRLATGPVALIEVQGYAFSALSSMAGLADKRGEKENARRWRNQASGLRKRVEAAFWMDEQNFYGIALDGSGELCRVRSSNAGHALFAGIPTPERAARTTRQLLTSNFDTGWGIRTVGVGQARFNPMSYHNGSIWPHDTAICAAGMARYGERDGLVRLTNEMFEAAVQFGMRLPELFCGFTRAPSEPPIAYPVACVPQAWAAGSIFMLLQALLGLRIDGWKREIHVDRPRLPIGIDRLEIHALAIADEQVDLVFERLGDRVVASPLRENAIPLLLHI